MLGMIRPINSCIAILTILKRGSKMTSGWSAVGGQTHSAYIRGGVDANDTRDGHTVRVSDSSSDICRNL